MQQRQEYKKIKKWKEADKIRKDVEDQGYQILDEENSYKIIEKSQGSVY
jgi:cysteinyl-tRNA synthetase